MSTIEDQIRTTLRTVAASGDVPPAPTLSGAAARSAMRRTSPSRRRRAVLGAAAAGLLLPVGAVGAAAAGGVAPPFLQDLFRLGGASVESLDLAGSLPLPDGQRYDVWLVTLDDGSRCVVEQVVDGDAPTDAPADGGAEGNGGLCSAGTPSPAGEDAEDAEDGSSVRPDFGDPASFAHRGTRFTFSVRGGDAERAELTLADGTRLPTIVAGGGIYGWVPGAIEEAPQLTGYAGDGEVVGEVTLDHLLEMLEPVDVEDAEVVEVSPSPGQTEGTFSSSGGPS